MQTSANVCPRHEMRRGHVKDQPARRVSPSAPLHSDLPTGLSASIAIAAAVGFNSIVTLLILPVNLKGTVCGQATALPSPTRISAPSSAEKDIGLCPVTSAGAVVALRRVPPPAGGSFLHLANLFVHVNRHNRPRSMHSTRTLCGIFLGFDRGCSCQK